MSGGEVRRVSREDIQLVQNLIERCLQLYMNQQEVVETLLVQAKIEPGFTELIWQKLEDENRDFFKAYHLRLMVKQQIIVFNKLLEQQVELMHQMRAGVTSISGSNGSNIQQLQQSSTCFAQGHNGTTLKPEYMQAPIGSNIPTVITNGGSGLQTIMHTGVDMSGHGPSQRIDVPSNMLRAQNSDIGNFQGMNGGMIKSEPSYSGNIPFMFSDDGNTLEPRSTLGDGSFNGVEANSQNLSEPQPLLDADTSTYGFLNLIPRNFSLTDLTADFNHSSDVWEYSRSPFLVTDAEAFLDSRERGENQGDDRKLGTISEYENFGSG